LKKEVYILNWSSLPAKELVHLLPKSFIGLAPCRKSFISPSWSYLGQ
jgi:hypothetical protein